MELPATETVNLLDGTAGNAAYNSMWQQERPRNFGIVAAGDEDPRPATAARMHPMKPNLV